MLGNARIVVSTLDCVSVLVNPFTSEVVQHFKADELIN